MVKGTIELRPYLCTGCRNCEVACSIAKENKILPAASRIKVLDIEPGPVDIPVLCHRCVDHPCVDACPPKVQALQYDEENNRVLVNPDKCLGVKCGQCSLKCRHQSAIYFHPETRKAIVCDQCDGDPACVRVCPTGAINYVVGTTMDGRYYAINPEELAKLVCLKVFGRHEIK